MRSQAASGTSRAGISPYLVALLGFAMFLNYTDRGSLSIVAPVLKQQLGISNAQMGLLLSAFFWSYAVAQPAAGWVAQRYAPRTVLAVATGLWSLATFACGLATGFAMLFAFRMLLGLAESLIFPTNARIFAEHALEHQRGRCNSAMSVGHSMGPTVGTLLGAAVLIAYGWRAVFFVLGALSLLWLIPWLARRDPSLEAEAAKQHQPAAYREILRERGLVGRLHRPVLLFLSLLPRSHLAAALPRQQPASLARKHGRRDRRAFCSSSRSLRCSAAGDRTC